MTSEKSYNDGRAAASSVESVSYDDRKAVQGHCCRL